MRKWQLEQCCKDILNGTEYMVSEENKKFLMDEVFCYHHDFEEKVGCGVRDIIVDRDGWGHKCFYFIRTDGSKTDISYVSSIRDKGSKQSEERRMINDIKKACREVVSVRVIDPLKSSLELPYVCPVTHRKLYKLKDIKVHHYDMVFDDLFSEWIKGKDIDALHRDVMNSSFDGSTRTYFSDDDIKDDFVKFHNEHTHLIAVSHEGHRKLHNEMGFMDEKTARIIDENHKDDLTLWDEKEKEFYRNPNK